MFQRSQRRRRRLIQGLAGRDADHILDAAQLLQNFRRTVVLRGTVPNARLGHSERGAPVRRRGAVALPRRGYGALRRENLSVPVTFTERASDSGPGRRG